MIDPWLKITESLRLSRPEKAVIEKYQLAPNGRSFLPLADVLKSHGYIQEGLELLLKGLQLHPNYTVARVILARELFNQGMCSEAWTTLEQSAEPLDENVLAQKLKLKLAILLGKEFEARETNTNIEKRKIYDDETKLIGEELKSSRFHKVKRRLIEKVKASGIRLEPLPETLPAKDENEETSTKSSLSDFEDEDPVLSGFHVMALQEVFRDPKDTIEKRDGVELDSTTLAEIYVKQGYYHKASEIYKRLLRLTPKNEFLARKLAEVTRLKREQREDDLARDPSVVNKMEQVEIIDIKMKFLQSMLDRLD